MKKYFTLLLSALSLGLFGQAYYQIPAINAGTNPGNLNNDLEEPGGYVAQVLQGYTLLTDSSSVDSWTGPQTIPFSFNFNGSAETTYFVSTSGVLTFASSAPSLSPGFTPSILPAASIPPKSVCAWGIELTGPNDAIVSKTFGSAPNRQHWIIWASASSSSLGPGWTYWGIVLEESSDNIYIVDMRTYSQGGSNVAITAGIQIDATTAYNVAGSPSLGSQTTATGLDLSDATDNTFYEFVYGSQPQYDLDLVSAEVPETMGLSASQSFEAIVQNKGSETINSFNYNYDDNQGGNGTTAISQTLAPGAFATININPAWTAPAAGTYNLDLSVSDPNGNTDSDPSNNSLSYTLVAAPTFPRVFLAEEFSSATCPPCKTWNDNVYNSALANYNTNNDPLVIKYQVPIPVSGDPSLNPDSETRRQYYGISSAPTMLGNGVEVDYSSVQTWGDAIGAYQAAEQAGSNEDAFIAVDGHATYNRANGSNTGEVTIYANVLSGIDLSSGNYALQMVVLQESYQYNNAPNGDFNYHHVMRKMLPNPNGTSLSLAEGEQANFTESYTFDIGNVSGGATNGNFNLWNNDVEAIVFVENRDTKKIMNAAFAGMTWIGMDETKLVKASIYPNPANDVLNIDFDGEQDLSVKINDLTGKTVFSSDFGLSTGEQINTSDLLPGMYIVQIIADGKIAAKRITITH